MKTLFYKPENGWAADFIPFYKDGVYYLYYLHDYREAAAHGEGTPWFLVTTKDFVHFEEHGEILARGTPEEQDLYVFTGCVFEADEAMTGAKYHLFYTGHNPHYISQGKPQEAVMHAVSSDLLHWEKRPGEMFFAPEGYEKHDWRDPFVFYDERTGKYNMRLAARRTDGPSRRRGVTARAISDDLRNWRVIEPLYAPGEYFTHECPDYFKMGGRYYLVFSEFTGDFRTQYRVSREPYGPFLKPEDCFFDNRALYAAKTAGDGRRRFLFGWNATRGGLKDSGGWEWGSHLVVHELASRPDGSLAVSPPRAVDRFFGTKKELPLLSSFGCVSQKNGRIETDARQNFACALLGNMPERFKLEFEADTDRDVRDFSVMLHASEDMENAYYIRYEFNTGRLVFDSWPRERADRTQMQELERIVRIRRGGKLRFKIFVSGTQLLVYLNGQTALGARMYDLRGGLIGFAQSGGRAAVTKALLYTN